jgi:protein TonB
MFEDSLVESRQGAVSSSKRWTALVSITLQVTVAGVIITLPLLHPEALPFHLEPPKLLLPLTPKPPAPPLHVQRVSESSPTTFTPASSHPLLFTTSRPSQGAASEAAPTLITLGGGMAADSALPGGLADAGNRPSVVRFCDGRILTTWRLSIVPVREMQRTSREKDRCEEHPLQYARGDCQRLGRCSRCEGGPVMLQNAALEAIRTAKYNPYRLNGEPTEVQTTITVNFRLAG